VALCVPAETSDVETRHRFAVYPRPVFMRRSYLLATLVALCAIAHASTLPVFTTKFMLPENSETLPELTEKVTAYIEDLIALQSLNLLQNWTVQVVLDQLPA
jgi:hypothetical protein